MGLNRSSGQVNTYVPSLDGIRGYGFLLVFCAHYFLPRQLANPGSIKYRLLSSVVSLAVFALPAFFVLSGFLIGGILYDTRNREGYFRIFYSRRVLRVFPVYYLALLGIYIFYAIHGIAPGYRFWVHFFYIHNLLPGYSQIKNAPVGMLHFWSLAVEEQFYMLWPLVVWLFPEKKKLLKIVTGLFLISFVLRTGAPLLFNADQYACFTPTSMDPILLGVALALLRGDQLVQRYAWIAKWVVLCAAATAIVLGAWKGREWAWGFWGEVMVVPLRDVGALALVVAVQEPNSLLQRVFCFRWVRWLGKMSYSAYVFHLLFAPFFFYVVTFRLSQHMRPHFAVIVAGIAAFCLTMLLSLLSGIFIEGPAMNLKRRFPYGAERQFRGGTEISEEPLVSTGA